MAALRHGIHTVIIPQDNGKDLEEIDQNVRSSLCFITVSHADSVMNAALNFPQKQALTDEIVQEKKNPLHIPQRKNKTAIRQ
jgi:ATP-dependent Lon protease